MMQVPNPSQTPLQEIANRLQTNYPGAVIKKPWIGKEMINIPVDNFRIFVRQRRDALRIDFQPPVLWTLGAFLISAVTISLIATALVGSPVIAVGGALPILIAIVAVKAIFKGQRKDFFERFQHDLEAATVSSGDSVLY